MQHKRLIATGLHLSIMMNCVQCY